ncbi:EF-hand domain-containing protein [Thiocystis violacea]|uniref:EF-hand domain-containing protein n=1 Tax=Thiocystis violacea TaxID=13725 RepID=UPI00190418D5|nr:EF-hand domain-containing protein [Thiocystis violacea]MBK1723171.1 hypothetical protein [Thiocystis violacea]
MSSILNSIGDLASSVYGANTTQTKRYGDPADSIKQVFSSLDTQGKGYLDAADFQSAFESLGLGSAGEGDESLTAKSAKEVVSVLDLDGDGQVTTEDMTQGLQTLTDSLGVLRGRDAMAGPEAMSGMPLPPTPEQVLGFTRDELTSQLETLTTAVDADTEDEGTQLLATMLADFDTADADGDGRISGEEAMAFAQSLDAAGATTAASTAGQTGVESASARETSTEQLVMRRIMALVDAYGSSAVSGEASDLLSELA